MNDEEKLKRWKKGVILLNWAYWQLEKDFKEGRISTRKRNKLKKRLSPYTMSLWKLHPDADLSMEKTFELHFS